MSEAFHSELGLPCIIIATRINAKTKSRTIALLNTLADRTVRDRRVQKHPLKSILIVMPLAGAK